MKIVRSLYMKGHQWRCLLRGAAVASWVRAWGGTVGKSLMVEPGVHFRNPPGVGWSIGSDVYLGRGVIIDVQPNAIFSVGRGTKIMQHTVIGVETSVNLGEDCLVAEFTSIRDANHGIDCGGLISQSPISSKPLLVGNDVWIGRGTAVLLGAHVSDGVVVGANSLVRGYIPAYSVAVGTPAKVVRQRLRTDKTSVQEPS